MYGLSPIILKAVSGSSSISIIVTPPLCVITASIVTSSISSILDIILLRSLSLLSFPACNLIIPLSSSVFASSSLTVGFDTILANLSVIKVAGVKIKIKKSITGATLRASLSALLKAYVLGITSAKITRNMVNKIVIKTRSN